MAGNKRECDLLIVGAGPAGFSAAINAASEGLDVVLVDSGPTPGGQAAQSTEIANYPGFPKGISGKDLIDAFMEQAMKFNTDIQCPQKVLGLHEGEDHHLSAPTEEGTEICSRAVILAPGLSYNRLAAKNIGAFMGRGALLGAPTTDPKALGECCICIVGGANSAGQAAVHLAKNEQARIKMLIRKTIDAGMSDYLIKKVRACKNIEIVEGVEVTAVNGTNRLECITLSRGKDALPEEVKTDHLFIFIGAAPKIQWLRDSGVQFDARNFIKTGNGLLQPGVWDVEKMGRHPFPFEAKPGIFAVGDVRANSIKRIASVVGEGSAVIPNVHQYLAMLNGK